MAQIIKSASGQQKVKMSKAEWEAAGVKAGWMKQAQVAPVQPAAPAQPRNFDPVELQPYFANQPTIQNKLDEALTPLLSLIRNGVKDAAVQQQMMKLFVPFRSSMQNIAKTVKPVK